MYKPGDKYVMFKHLGSTDDEISCVQGGQGRPFKVEQRFKGGVRDLQVEGQDSLVVQVTPSKARGRQGEAATVLFMAAYQSQRA